MSVHVRRSHYQVTYGVLAVSVSAFALLQSLVTPVLAEIQVDLGTSQTTVTWVLTAYLLSASVCTPIVGRVGDKVGKERMLVFALVALAIGSLIAALATSIGPMILARVIQGIGGGVLPLAFGIIRDEFPEKKVPGAVGTVASLAAVGAGAGLVLAGPIVNAFNYHWLFWFPMIVTALAAVAATLFVPESPVRTPGKISVLPAVLLSAWLVALLLALSQGARWGWTSGRILGLLAAAVVLAIAWVMVELRSDSPLIDMQMMRLPAVWTTNLVALLVGFAMYASFGFLPQFAQTPHSLGTSFDDLAGELALTPPHLDPLTRIRAATTATVRTNATIPDNRRRLRVIARSPSLQSATSPPFVAWRTVIRNFARQHLHGPSADLTAEIIATAVQSVTMTTLTWWAEHGQTPPDQLLDQTLGSLEDGFNTRLASGPRPTGA